MCPLCVIINVVFHSSIGVRDDGDHDGSRAPDIGDLVAAVAAV